MLQRCKLSSMGVNKRLLKIHVSMTIWWSKYKARGKCSIYGAGLAKQGSEAKSFPLPGFPLPTAKNEFYTFKWLEESPVHDVRKLYGTWTLVPINKLYWTQQSPSFRDHLWLLLRSDSEPRSCNEDQMGRDQTKPLTLWSFTKICLLTPAVEPPEAAGVREMRKGRSEKAYDSLREEMLSNQYHYNE